jgi:hypothetical protein
LNDLNRYKVTVFNPYVGGYYDQQFERQTDLWSFIGHIFFTDQDIKRIVWYNTSHRVFVGEIKQIDNFHFQIEWHPAWEWKWEDSEIWEDSEDYRRYLRSKAKRG